MDNERNSIKKIIFSDSGVQSDKNENWFISDGLTLEVTDNETTLKMSELGVFNYSPNIAISGDFDLIVDINMPEGSSFLSFGFSKNQNDFTNYEGFWNSINFQKLCIKRRNGFIRYYLDDTLKTFQDFDDDNIFFQFRFFSLKRKFQFSYKNFKIITFQNEYDNLIEDVKRLKNQIAFTNTILDSYQYYFNILFVEYQLEPKELMYNNQQLCMELLNFIDNICKKYDIEYWLDYGNLLGAVRHEGFIPWDDDMDIGMMRKDYDKLLKILPLELKNNNLDKLDIRISNQTKTQKNTLLTFTQILLFDAGLLYCGLDIFPYDFLDEYPDNYRELFFKEKNNHYVKLIEGMNREKVFQDVFNNLNLKYDDGKYITSGVEHGKVHNRQLIIEKEKIFPLRSMPFEGNEYPCPNDSRYYAYTIYKNYYDISKIARVHGRQKRLRKRNRLAVNRKFRYLIRKFREANNQFNNNLIK